MRIKCRAWHTKLNRMFSAEEMAADQLTLMPDGSGFINVSGDSTRLSQPIPSMIPLVYIESNDKDGIEICEADIVRRWNEKEFIGEPQVVEPTKCGWNPFIDDMQTDGSWHYGIIGNKYENPELLPSPKKP